MSSRGIDDDRRPRDRNRTSIPSYPPGSAASVAGGAHGQLDEYRLPSVEGQGGAAEHDGQDPWTTAVEVAEDEAISPRASTETPVIGGVAPTVLRIRDMTRATALSVWQRISRITTEQWAWIGILVLATTLRFWGLGDKPLHHDESMHAFYSLLFARDPSSYAYNPLLHGPFQFHAEGLMFALILALQHLFGAGGPAGNPWINDTTARIVPALFGTAIVVLPFWLRRELGRIGALGAAFILAISPAFVYFSRFLREDIYFNFFMFAMVVCAVRFAVDRKPAWFVGLAVATTLAYATFEGIYLTLVIFIGFLVVLAVWELAYKVADRLPDALTARERLFFSRVGSLLALALVGSVIGLIGLHVMATLSSYINAHTSKTDVQVRNLENISVAVMVYLSIVAALIVIAVLVWQLTHPEGVTGNPYMDSDSYVADDRGPWSASQLSYVQLNGSPSSSGALPSRAVSWLRDRLDPEQQPMLHLLLTTNWVYWFVAAVLAWIVFIALYWVLPGSSRQITLAEGFTQGVGSGMWQGLYYWLQQQQVARGGQPPYYYLMLIPMYEQLAVVLGVVGIVYTIRHPNRFRLFLVWWFAASLFMYSWAGEKMPWLSIHILLPLVLLGGVAVQPLAIAAWDLVQRARVAGIQALRPLRRRAIAVSFGVVSSLLLIIPVFHSMVVLSHQDAAKGPLEMMVYVQTTDDVDLVMNKIATADQQMYGGKHLLKIGIDADESWPMYWYLRDYYLDPHPSASANFAFNPNVAGMPTEDVLILSTTDAQTFMAQHPKGYTEKEYALRAWFDEAYKPLPCVPTKANPCPAAANWGSGAGIGNYLTYGSNPPPNAHFNPFSAAGRLWSWLWLRQPLGATNGSFDFVFIVRNGVPIKP